MEWTIPANEYQKCCGVGGQITEERECKTIANGYCLGVLDKRKVDCSEACDDKKQCPSVGK